MMLFGYTVKMAQLYILKYQGACVKYMAKGFMLDDCVCVLSDLTRSTTPPW